jgi:hypothetical protein
MLGQGFFTTRRPPWPFGTSLPASSTTAASDSAANFRYEDIPDTCAPFTAAGGGK